MSFALIQDYVIAAGMSVGSNSLLNTSIPELSVGPSPEDQAVSQFQWDSNTADGFDSGWLDVKLEVNVGGGAGGIAWTVGGVRTVYSGAAYDDIYGFTLRAGVDGAGDTVSFRNILGKFYYGAADSTWGETDEFDDVAATTVGVNDPDDEAIVEVIPEGSGFKRAVFCAQVRLQAGAGLPDPGELFGQVFLFAEPV